MRRRKQLGELASVKQSQVTLDEFAREWWERYASTELARKTQERYAAIWDLHVLPRLGAVQLGQLKPGVIDAFQAELRKAGVGEPTIRKTLALLQAICREAVTWGRISSNPVKPVRKWAVVRKRVVRPLTPESVEKVRRQLKKPRDQALVSLLAYAGLRPGEALGLRWGDIGERTILVERAISHGEEKSTKTRATRSVRMVKPLKSELASRAAINARSASRSPPFRGTAARCCASTLRAARIAHMNLLVVKFVARAGSAGGLRSPGRTWTAAWPRTVASRLSRPRRRGLRRRQLGRDDVCRHMLQRPVAAEVRRGRRA